MYQPVNDKMHAWQEEAWIDGCVRMRSGLGGMAVQVCVAAFLCDQGAAHDGACATVNLHS